MNKCDIIIPIYNAYDCVVECIESVIKNTVFNGNKLILINDCSTDDRIATLLQKYENTNKNIIVLNNDQNLGFVGTVNRGMKFSKNDVLLLNSDTEVTHNWLKKIMDCAYSSENIATVTPLSNNATLASVPNSFEANDIPAGYTLEQMASLVERCSLKYYPEIPTGHGFCLYIKRKVIEKVGFFDQESYGKGYGEENDFCFRCFEFGYRHVLCDDTYILHKESMSFQNSKKDLIEDGLKVLKRKYPEYVSKLEAWCAKKPLNYIGNNIAFEIGNLEARKNILLVIHNWKDAKINLGGTTLHVLDLVNNMRNKYNFHIFTPEDGIYKVYSYFEKTEMEVNYQNLTLSTNVLNYYDNEYRRLLNQIVEDYNISFVHIHHIIGHYFDMVDVFKNHNISYMITLHDFYSVCPLINKLYKNEEYCGLNPSIEKCSECLKTTLKVNIDITSWRKEWKRLLDNAYKVITPSNSTKEEIQEIYNELSISVIEHGIDIKKETSTLRLGSKNDIAFIGAIGVHKGGKILDELIKINKNKNCTIHLFGIKTKQYSNVSKNFIDHGRYTRNELKELLKKYNIKLICLFSIWPETYSYTLTEAIACGIPVVSFDLGAIAERVSKYNLGWTLEHTLNSKEILKKINGILSNERAYNEVIKSINQYEIISSEKMSNEYNSIYSKKATLIAKLPGSIRDKIVNNRVFLVESYNNDYSWVFNTLKWKIISFFKIPKPIKKVYRKIKQQKGDLDENKKK